MGIDWAGILVSRLVGKNLENHYRECIFDPAGMIDTTFFPSSSIKSRMMNLTHDPGDGQIKTLHDNFSSIPSGLDRTSEPDETGPVLAGGAGLFSTARDYLAFLRGIMASGPAVRDCFPPAIPLLSTESFKELFIDSIPSSADRSYFLDTIKAQNYHDPALLLERVDGRRRAGHSVGLLLNFEDSCHGRKAGSGCWDGAARTQYWLDPTTGLAVRLVCGYVCLSSIRLTNLCRHVVQGICMTNIMTDDAKAIKKFYNDVEKAAYEALSY
jgi:methyl acetate hydrolase